MSTFGITNNPNNHALMATVGARIKADARMLAATATFWRLLGFGGLLLLGGIGVGLASFGYSYVTDQRATMAKVTTALADALNKVTLKTDGTVKLAPDSTVKLDTKGASVRLDPSGMPRPTPQQLAPDTLPQSRAKVVTDFSVFKIVNFGEGAVITGWGYDSSADAAPSEQLCYYTVQHHRERLEPLQHCEERHGISASTRIPGQPAAGGCQLRLVRRSGQYQAGQLSDVQVPPHRSGARRIAARLARPSALQLLHVLRPRQQRTHRTQPRSATRVHAPDRLSTRPPRLRRRPHPAALPRWPGYAHQHAMADAPGRQGKGQVGMQVARLPRGSAS